jgi:hypothetical protein
MNKILFFLVIGFGFFSYCAIERYSLEKIDYVVLPASIAFLNLLLITIVLALNHQKK